jgi:DNA-binding response OmpR family regulator
MYVPDMMVLTYPLFVPATPMPKLLLVEDDLDLCSRMVEWLSFEQHTVEVVHDGQEASDRLKLYQYELVILDWQLPKLSGVELCKRFRSSGGKTPILMLTGRTTVDDKEEGLDSGADDYLTKPFHMKELSARIRALMRRPAALSSNILKVGDYTLDTVTKRLTCDGREIDLSPKEYALMEFFMRHPDVVFSQDALLERVWSSESDASIFSVYTAVKTLRKKICPDGVNSILVTVHGMGYRLESR